MKESNLISEPKITGLWEAASLPGTEDQLFRETVLLMLDGGIVLSFVGVY